MFEWRETTASIPVAGLEPNRLVWWFGGVLVGGLPHLPCNYKGVSAKTLGTKPKRA